MPPGFDPFQRAREVGKPMPSKVGPYMLSGLLGEGGFGHVYKATDPAGRQVALKLLKRTDAKRLSRFQVEAEATARLNHPNVIRVHAAGEHAGQPYLVTELVSGCQNLEDALASTDRAGGLALILAAARGLEHAHQAGIAHRDVKPDNVLVDEQGHVRVADFGLALDAEVERLTLTGQLLGTPAYMSPEQARRKLEPAEAMRSDVWALGVILYEFLCGARPFAPMAVLYAQSKPPLPVSPRKIDSTIPRALERVCLRAIQWESSERFPTAGDFAGALSLAMTHDAARPWTLRGGLVIGASISVALVLAASHSARQAPGPISPPAKSVTPAPDSLHSGRSDLSAFLARRPRAEGLARAEWFRDAWGQQEPIRASLASALKIALERDLTRPLWTFGPTKAEDLRFLRGDSLAVRTPKALFVGRPGALVQHLEAGEGTFSLGSRSRSRPPLLLVPQRPNARWLQVDTNGCTPVEHAVPSTAAPRYVRASTGPGGTLVSWIERATRPPRIAVSLDGVEIYRDQLQPGTPPFQDPVPSATWTPSGEVLFYDGESFVCLESPRWKPRRLQSPKGVVDFFLSGSRLFARLRGGVTPEVFFDLRAPRALPLRAFATQHAFAIDPEGEWLYALGHDRRGQFYFCSWRAQGEGWTISRQIKSDLRLGGLAVSADGAWVAVAGERGVAVWGAGGPKAFRD